MYFFQSSRSAVLGSPITLIVVLLHFTLTPWSRCSYRVPIGAAMVLAGLSIFLFGVDIGVTPIGNVLGEGIAKTNRIWMVVVSGRSSDSLSLSRSPTCTSWPGRWPPCDTSSQDEHRGRGVRRHRGAFGPGLFRTIIGFRVQAPDDLVRFDIGLSLFTSRSSWRSPSTFRRDAGALTVPFTARSPWASPMKKDSKRLRRQLRPGRRRLHGRDHFRDDREHPRKAGRGYGQPGLRRAGFRLRPRAFFALVGRIAQRSRSRCCPSS